MEINETHGHGTSPSIILSLEQIKPLKTFHKLPRSITTLSTYSDCCIVVRQLSQLSASVNTNIYHHSRVNGRCFIGCRIFSRLF